MKTNYWHHFHHPSRFSIKPTQIVRLGSPPLHERWWWLSRALWYIRQGGLTWKDWWWQGVAYRVNKVWKRLESVGLMTWPLLKHDSCCDGYRIPTSAGVSASRMGNNASRANWNIAVGWTSWLKAWAAVEHGRENALANRWLTEARTGSEEKDSCWDGGVVTFVVIADDEGNDCIPEPGSVKRIVDVVTNVVHNAKILLLGLRLVYVSRSRHHLLFSATTLNTIGQQVKMNRLV